MEWEVSGKPSGDQPTVQSHPLSQQHGYNKEQEKYTNVQSDPKGNNINAMFS